MSESSKLHLGCGKRFLKGYTHVDLDKFQHIDIVADISDLHMIPNESVDEIYCSHAFEYFDRYAAQGVLREWHRILAFNGWLFLVVPDFDQLCKVYSATGELGDILGPLFGRWNVNDTFAYHKTVYNRHDLTKLLVRSGFHEIEEFSVVDFLSAIDPKYDDHSLAFFPHLDRSGIQISLALKAKKMH